MMGIGKVKPYFLPILIFSGLVLFSAANAASFQLTPQTGSFNNNQRFFVTVFIDTEGAAINAAEGVLTFDPRYLQVESVSTDVSIFKFWAQEPTFSNAAGTISFSGGLPTPGYTGSSGKVLSVVFRAVAAGESRLRFSSGAILANDGLSTNVLTSSEEARYAIRSLEAAPPLTPIEEAGAPAKPLVKSSTHPEAENWYNAETFIASWDLPEGVSGVNYALFSDPGYVLPRKSKGLVSEASYNVKELGDRVWYFFVRFRNSAGWGGTAVRTVKVDTTPPKPFKVVRIDIDDPTNPQPVLVFETTDETSGMDRYEIKIDGGQWTVAESPYILPIQTPGTRSVVVKALDIAGNFTEGGIEIIVEPIETPVITGYSEEFRPPGESLVVSGRSGKGFTILGALKRAGEVYAFSAEANEFGEWRAEFREPIPAGTYELTVKARDKRGALSLETEPVLVKRVRGVTALHVLGGAVGLIALLFVLLKLLIRIKCFRKFLKRELHKIEKKI